MYLELWSQNSISKPTTIYYVIGECYVISMFLIWAIML